MHIADPHQAVTLDAVPNIILHVQLHSIGTHAPDLVQALIAAFKMAHMGQIANNRQRLNGLNGKVGVQRLNLGKAKAHLTKVHGTHHAQLHHHVTHRMIVGRILLADAAQGLHHALAKHDPRRRPHNRRTLGGNIQCAVDLTAKIQQYIAALFDLHTVFIVKTRLHRIALQKVFRALAVLVCHHPGGFQIMFHIILRFPSRTAGKSSACILCRR